MRTDTKAMLEECTYNNGCISGVDCEGCAVEVTIIMNVSCIVLMIVIKILFALMTTAAYLELIVRDVRLRYIIILVMMT